MDSVVCFLFPGSRDYKPEYVNVLERMVSRHMPEPHRFVCVMDGFDRGDFSDRVEVIDTPPEAVELGRIVSPHGARFPTSLRRLVAFSEWGRCLGDRIMLLDIDCVIVRSLERLFSHQADFVAWRPKSVWGNLNRIAGGTWLLRTGTHTHVWERFQGEASLELAHAAGWMGTDQAWISYCLAETAESWPADCGIYQSQDYYVGTSRKAMLRGRVPPWQPPDDAVICHFNGPTKPWEVTWPWVVEHWR